MSTTSLSFSFPFFLFLLCSVLAQATVPASKTFKYINDGGYGEYTDEYNANYRLLGDLQGPNFAMCFFNTTPSAYTLAIRMGSRPEDSTSNIMRWVWSANRNNPVGEKATLTFGSNGNLVLAQANGRIVWQTGTANKGVVGLELLATGNLVLVDNRGRFVWQSFNYPTDTLMVGQGLRKGGVTQLVSRVSNVDGSNGRYSLVLEKERLALYLKSKNSPNPILYYTAGNFEGSTVNSVVLSSAPASDEGISNLSYDFFLDNSKTPASVRLARPKYNSTLSFIRVESDGNIRMYTYKDNAIFGAWETTYTLFNRDGTRSVSECKLPTKCGSLGVCQNNQCVGCPTPKGLLGWSEKCAPPKLVACKKGAPSKGSYYKVKGVEHFTSDYTEGDGPVNVNECRGKCDAECGCLGFFYREESSKCYLAYELGALTRVSNQSHVAYIKSSR